MAFAPISLTIPQYDELTYAGWWLKAYSQGTTTPLNMATDATGTTTLVKALLDSEGFPITSSTGPQFIPFIDGDYDLWLFPTEGEADGNITVNAVQLADDLNADPSQSVDSFLDAVTPLTANTTIAVTHKNEIVDCTNTITLTFTAAATLGAGFAFVARNKGAGVITCDANSAETINGALTLILGIGEWAVFICDGTNWSAIVGNSLGGRWVKGADVASTAAMTLGADGNYFDITGTTAITSIVTRGATGAIKLHFDGALTLTHDATDLILPGGANITTAAGDETELIEYATGDWRCLTYQVAADTPGIPGVRLAGASVQVVNTLDTAVATGTTLMPFDDTIPQITEGDEYMTRAITPTDASNLLKVEVVVNFSHTSVTSINAMAALFQDATAGALAVSSVASTKTTTTAQINFIYWMVAGTASATTFRIRVGSDTAGTITFNGISAARIGGGVMTSSITITEYKV